MKENLIRIRKPLRPLKAMLRYLPIYLSAEVKALVQFSFSSFYTIIIVIIVFTFRLPILSNIYFIVIRFGVSSTVAVPDFYLFI